MTLRPTALLAILWLASTAVPASARQFPSDMEIIESFDIAMEVEAGGSMLVTERITVRARGNQIKRGIFRDFPTTFPRRFNIGRIEAPFEVVSVTRGGVPETFRVEGIGEGFGRGGVRIRIGRRDVILKPGTYVYEITYWTDRWVRFGREEDQIYWNVTGNGWSFPIETASATVRVEGLTTTPTLESWTGPEGSTGMQASGSWDASSGTAHFETTEALWPGDGLTVRLTFPAGQLPGPSEETMAEWFRMDFGGYVDAGYLILLVIAVYLLMWRQVGIDPAPGPTRLRTEPPEGYSPAELGYIQDRGYEQEHLSAALVNLALKGAIRITNDGSDWTLHKLVSKPEGLAPEEQDLFSRLLGPRKKIDLERRRHAILSAAIKSFRLSLRRRLERIYFENNRNWFYAGVAVSVVGFGVLVMRWSYAINPAAIFLALWLTLWTMGTGTLVARILQTVVQAKRGRSPVLYGGAGALALFAAPFVFGEALGLAFLLSMVPTHLVVAAVALGVINVLFYHLLERPTLKGRGVLNELDGFRSWLKGEDGGPAGEDRSVAVFERHLPYAIALGLDDRWTEAFSDVLEPLMAKPRGQEPFPWYDHDGLHDRSFSPRSFSSSLSSSLASTLSTNSSPPPSSGGGSSSGGGFSSGGGGGGFSGGGGGGGGGGGW